MLPPSTATVGRRKAAATCISIVEFVSTRFAIVVSNALPLPTPVFAEVDPETYNLDPAAAEAAITPRTKAILKYWLDRSARYDQRCATHSAAQSAYPVTVITIGHAALWVAVVAALLSGADYFRRFSISSVAR